MTTYRLGEHTPDAAIGPQRTATGAQRPPRALMRFEQERATVAWMLGETTRKHDRRITKVEAEVTWGDRSTSRIELGIAWENTPDGVLATLSWQKEYGADGEEMVRRGGQWIAQVRAEMTGAS